MAGDVPSTPDDLPQLNRGLRSAEDRRDALAPFRNSFAARLDGKMSHILTNFLHTDHKDRLNPT
jgi:hypothetical protein